MFLLDPFKVSRIIAPFSVKQNPVRVTEILSFRSFISAL
jgi:hypothetical protein